MNAVTTTKIKIGRRKVEIILDVDLVDAIDRAATRERMTRTAWLIQAALHHLPVDIGQTIEKP